MSTQRKAEYTLDPASDEAVHEYLSEHPDFFERHDDLLDSLRLPHVTGATVSLVERQVSMLRQKDLKLERRLRELLEVARTNDVLAEKIHQLALRLLAAQGMQETLLACENALRTGFDADQSVLVLFAADPDVFKEVDAGRVFRAIERDHPALRAFDSFLSASTPRCGQIRDAQRDFLFGTETNEVGSCALVPLGTKCEIGFLAVGSADADRFSPAMSMDFVSRLGELIAVALKRY